MSKLGNGSLVYEHEVETLKFDWGRIRMLSSPDITGAKNFSFGVVESLPGTGHESHNHPEAEEIIYLVSGECELMLDRQPPIRIQPGACIHIPAGVYHYTANVGRRPMITLIVYSPVGPEKKLRNAPDCKVTAASLDGGMIMAETCQAQVPQDDSGKRNAKSAVLR
ncbi:MAG: cupin domain-containing protein [Verrucomicrobiota bacterium]|jgi:oxalate decarboxylase/phosphoglucose isomerase-like protein (cupin superfamily)